MASSGWCLDGNCAHCPHTNGSFTCSHTCHHDPLGTAGDELDRGAL